MSKEKTSQGILEVILGQILRKELTEDEFDEVTLKLREWFQDLQEIRDDEIIDIEPVIAFYLGQMEEKNYGNKPTDNKQDIRDDQRRNTLSR